MKYDKDKYLRQIDKEIEKGKYKDNWDSLSAFRTPKWYRNAKFGIFIHWGVFAVPAFGSEWYSRNMYLEGTKEYEHHLQTYGPHDTFGYREFIPMFTASEFNASKWADLFLSAGARYVTPVAEHHDGFQMYHSELSAYCASKMGPKRDILKELKEEIEKRELVFCTSSHRAEHYWFMEGIRKADSENEDLREGGLYWPSRKGPDDIYDIHVPCPNASYLEDWLIRTCELIDRYKPKMLYFDWWIMNVAFKPYLKKCMAYYYNRGDEWGEEVSICYKFDACASGTGIEDIERGLRKDIHYTLWQGDTSTARNSWSYTPNNDYKDAQELIQNLIDIVSKNGTFMLNIGPKADGTIPDEEVYLLKEIGQWLAVNGEGIYDTTNWKIAQEGAVCSEEGHFTDTKKALYTANDIRYTYKKGIVYAFVLQWPEDGTITLTSFAPAKKQVLAQVGDVKVLGSDKTPAWRQVEEGLIVTCSIKSRKLPVCMRLEII